MSLLLDTPVSAQGGGYPANDFGLWHMLGNVHEWVADGYRPDYHDAPRDASVTMFPAGSGLRVFRGGAFDSAPVGLRSASRGKAATSHRAPNLGFRVARVLRS